MNPFSRTEQSKDIVLSEDGPLPQPSSRMMRDDRTGVVVAYPERFYADHKGLELLKVLRRHLPDDEYREALPAQILKCCAEIRGVLSGLSGLETIGTFDLGSQHIRFRAVAVPPKRPAQSLPILILLEAIENHSALT